jgi:ribonuclease-3
MLPEPGAIARALRSMGLRVAPDPNLLRAFVHSSYVNESGGSDEESNQRLEFLGDAVLGFVVAEHLHEQFPEAGEGVLTEMRAALVRGTTLAEVASRYDIGTLLVLGKGEEGAGGRARHRNLAGALEAVIGAVYLGSGIRRARALILRILGPEIAALEQEGVLLDPKSRLQHIVQARWHEPPRYQTVSEGQTDAEDRFVVAVYACERRLAEGSGRSKRRAQQTAAMKALEFLIVDEHPKERA